MWRDDCDSELLEHRGSVSIPAAGYEKVHCTALVGET
jgi:hypothetical protein